MFDQIAFVSPWLLGFLVALPLIWWLLRLTPPAPRKIRFPALELLRGIVPKDETPAQTPWWLLLLRLLIAACIILAFADPLLHPTVLNDGRAPLFIVIDNDWAAARDWNDRQDAVAKILARARMTGQPVWVLPTAQATDAKSIAVLGPLTADAAKAELNGVEPHAWASDWAKASEVLQEAAVPSANIFWISSGIGNTAAKNFYHRLQALGTVHVLISGKPIYSLDLSENESGVASVVVMRGSTAHEASLFVDAIGRDGNILAHMPVSFTVGAPQSSADLVVPQDVRNQVVRLDIAGQMTAASVYNFDSHWEHRSVGLVGDQAELDQHSLLSSLFYIDRALKPFADLHVGDFASLIKQDVSIIVISDEASLNPGEIPAVKEWIQKGGMLVSFASDALAMNTDTATAELLPVTLRAGDRSMGGALSWAAPQKLHPFNANSPFAGIAIPEDVTVNRQILAEPDNDLAQKTWASLDDGTPLVTAKKLGQGTTVLFHVPARSDWSNLPLSGLFVDMLRRLIDLSSMRGSDINVRPLQLAPLQTTDAFGELHPADANVESIADKDIDNWSPDPHHPPGLYGTEGFNKALNLGKAIGQPQILTEIPVEGLTHKTEDRDLKPWLLACAFVLFLIDYFISLRLRGLSFQSFTRRLVPVFIVMFMGVTHHASANDSSDAVELTSQTYLAYVHTGEKDTDHISATGLTTLARVLEHRTSIDHVGVVEIDPNTDNLAFFPFVYWPIIPSETPLTPMGIAHVNNYLRHGGMILFDTMDGQEPSASLTTRILSGINMPPLIPLPDDHVLKHTFYIIEDEPGRYMGSSLWLEPEDASSYDGVATVLFGSNGWAAAWATDDKGRPAFPCVPGGELQREQSLRFGVNLTMYALTGNYKADQLHMQALLERMGK